MTAYTAANSTEFSTARGNAVAGDTIELTGTSYNGFSWGKVASSEILVFGSDPNNKPTITFTSSQNLDNCQNITYKWLEFSKPWQSGDGNQEQLYSADNVTNLKFEECRFVGGKVNGGTDSNGRAFQIIGGNGFTFLNCEATEWTKFIVAGGLSNFTLKGCHIYDIKSDGITLDAITTALIEGNYFHDFAVGVSAEHPDMIQFTINSGRLYGSSNISIIGNIFDSGVGRYGQLIFGGNGGQAVGGVGTALRRTGYIIRDNTIFGDHTNFIKVDYMDYPTVDHNTLVLVTNGYPFTPGADIDCGLCYGATITNNICDAVSAGTSPVQNTNNQIVNSASLLTYFDKLHWVDDGDTYNGLSMKSGTSVSTSGAGARTMQKADGWGGAGIVPHPAYLDGFQSGGLQTLPVGSVAASVTVQ